MSNIDDNRIIAYLLECAVEASNADGKVHAVYDLLLKIGVGDRSTRNRILGRIAHEQLADVSNPEFHLCNHNNPFDTKWRRIFGLS